jgi:hypothetical protein
MTTLASPNPFDFLAHPPPPRAPTSSPRVPTPTVETISHRRSSTVAAISTWVAGVLPGSPPPASPPTSSTFSRRPSLFGPPRTARQHSKTFISFADTRDPNSRAPTYACTVVPLPIPPHPSIPSQSAFHAKREYESSPDEMKLPPLSAIRLRNTSTQVVSDSRSPSVPKKKGFMRFLQSRPRSRSTHARKTLPLPPSSPTTIAFRIAHQKRALYARCGALPLPLDSEVAIMQFMDGGSRADAVARLGPTYKDEAGVIYTDEAEARECLPLLLPVENDGEDVNLPGGLPSARSASEGFTVTSLSASSLSKTSPPPAAQARDLPTQTLVTASSPLALLSIPARGGGDSVPGYLHTSPPSLPLPSGGLGSNTQLAKPVDAAASRGKRRRRPVPLTLHLPANAMGFEDSFSPCVVVEAPSPTTQ